jgi:DNA/RNA endonuclease YhcR with UshA esterase domain
MVKSGDNYSANLLLSGYKAGDMIFYKIQTTNSTNEKTNLRASYLLPEKISADQLTSISNVQGIGSSSPLMNQEVTISGRITGNFDNTYYIQSGKDKRSGICVYNSLFTGKEGDSIVVTGTATEYSDLTEIGNVRYVSNFKSNKTLKPIVLTASQVNEDYEGMLVQINNVTFDKPGSVIQEQNMSYTATDNTGSVVVYINKYSRLVRKSFPAQVTNLVGIVSQFQGTFQILPRDINDFKNYSPVVRLLKTEQGKLFAFPNPATTILNIKSDQPIHLVKIINISGQVVQLLKQDQNQINIQRLVPGIYILEATFDDSTTCRIRFSKF